MLNTIAESIKSQVSERALNQNPLTELALTAFFAGGHILLTGPTGLGKTHWARTFTGALGINFNHIHITDDATPPHLSQDENFTIATANSPLHLPKPLADRFMMHLSATYPGVAAEKQMLQMHHVGELTVPPLHPICTTEIISQAKQEVRDVGVEDAVFNYIISIVETTRRIGAVQEGASPRGSIALLMAAKARAAIKGRDYASLEDVQVLAQPVLAHRLTLKPEATREGMKPERVIESILTGRRG